MAWLRRTRPNLSAADLERTGLSRGDDPLALMELPQAQARLVVTSHHLVLLPDAGTALVRPWHLVDHAAWARDDATLRISWVDDAPPLTIPVAAPDTRSLQALRERVQASVVTHEDVRLPRGSVRVVVRQDLATRELVTQTLYAGGARPGAPGVAEAVAEVTARLRDAVGLPEA